MNIGVGGTGGVGGGGGGGRGSFDSGSVRGRGGAGEQRVGRSVGRGAGGGVGIPERGGGPSRARGVLEVEGGMGSVKAGKRLEVMRHDSPGAAGGEGGEYVVLVDERYISSLFVPFYPNTHFTFFLLHHIKIPTLCSPSSPPSPLPLHSPLMHTAGPAPSKAPNLRTPSIASRSSTPPSPRALRSPIRRDRSR